MKKILTLFLMMIFLGLNQAGFAVPNYTYTKVTDEKYSASSPVGQFVNYAPETYQQTYETTFGPYHDVTYVNSEPLPVSYQNIEVPQNYNKTTVMTEQMRDDRETADKVIDRAWNVTGILGTLGLVTVGIMGIVSAIF